MKKNDYIIIEKASEHNLKEISLKIPKNKLCVITGPSGSGKSSLAFDTIYVEGQRRYIESLSSYARQFLGQHRPPKVESISGLSPAVAIDQKTSGKGRRSTVGTTTEIYDYLRILYARVGTLFCPKTGDEIKKYSVTQVAKELLLLKEKTKLQLLAPLEFKNQNELKSEVSKIETLGLTRMRANKEILKIEEVKKLNFKKIEELEVVIDRILLKEGVDKRLADSIETSFKIGNGNLIVLIGDEEKESYYSENFFSFKTKTLFPDLSPQLFSFNSPIGACQKCNGLGESKAFDIDELILDENFSIDEGAIIPLAKKRGFLYKMTLSVIKEEKIDIKRPVKDISVKDLNLLFYGSKKVYTFSFTSKNSHFKFKKSFPGIISYLEQRYQESVSEKKIKELESYMKIDKCSLCHGLRLNEVALSTKIFDFTIMDLCSLSISDLLKTLSSFKFSGEKAIISEKLLKEITSRLQFLVNVGLNYLSLNRSTSTLSGGESQRIRLATQIGSALSGVLYVLDEPSIGLHQKDNQKLIKTLMDLRDLGNTVLVVEHDEETMLEADYIIDMGPLAGEFGGEIVAVGTPEQIIKNKKSLTGQYLSGKKSILSPSQKRNFIEWIKLKGAQKNNLKNIDIEIPLQALTSITGVSGSGKSTLIHEVLIRALQTTLKKETHLFKNTTYQSISGVQHIQSIIEIDQSPIGRTPKSNPATYSEFFDDVRTIFSKLPESQVRGYKPGRFSFNVKGGRCEECEGNGVKKVEMHFLPDVYVECSECKGSRYNRETLSILFKGKNISDVLNMSIYEACDFFSNHKKIHRILTVLIKVGLGYMKLGQPATTLSGGEAQRLKLAKELGRNPRGKCFYVLDEPTTGLHFEDINILLNALQELVELGHSVVVIEHNLEVIKSSDFIIDLGPDGGDKGGFIVTTGTPEDVCKNKNSYTGQFLKKYLKP